MKCLFIARDGNYGGGHSLLYLLTAAPRDVALHVLCRPDTVLARHLAELGIPFSELPADRLSRRRPWQYPSRLRAWTRTIRSIGPDVVVANDLSQPTITSGLAALGGRPIICVARMTPHRRRWTQSWALRGSQGVICITEFVKERLEALYGKLPIPATVIYNPQPAVVVSSEARASIVGELRLSPYTRLIGQFGAIIERKAVDVTITAVRNILRRVPHVHVVIVGNSRDTVSNRAYRQHLDDLIVRNGLEDNITFLGFRHDVSELMSACDLTVLPSRSEALGRVLLESWAVGTPVVGAAHEGIEELVVRSGGGVLFDPGSAASLAEAVSQLLGESDAAAVMGERGREWVRTNCEPQVYAERFFSFVKDSTRIGV